MHKRVRVSGLDFGFRKRPLFEGVSLELDPGVNFIVGANGAGKTTLFRLILGDLKPRKGSIYIPSGKVGYLPQSFGHPPRFTVEEFVTHFAWLHGVPRKDRPRAVQDAITAVGLEARAGDRMGHLSGGMLRRAGIAQALVHRPVLVLLDEPTTGLDPRQRADLRNLLVQLGESTTLVVNTHLLEDVAAIGGHIVVLDAGTIRFTGSISDLAEHGGSGSLDQAFLALTTGVTA